MNSRSQPLSFFLAMLMLVVGASSGQGVDAADGWPRHVIDDSSEGADGIRLRDVNADGLPDICTPWEQGGVIRVYLNPGASHSKEKWAAVTVGEVVSPEDAVLLDLDQDGRIDVVSCCEGDEQQVYFHWAPAAKNDYMRPEAWSTQAVPAAAGQKWMFCVPMQVDGKHGVDLIVGSKLSGGTVSWLECPEDARDMSAWRLHKLSDARWIMTLQPLDMDGDGDLDVLLTDREGRLRGVRWLENPGVAAIGEGLPWNNHSIGGKGMRTKFLETHDMDQDGVLDLFAATRNNRMLYLRRESSATADWTQQAIPNPFGHAWGKSIRIADINQDGKLDLVHNGNSARNGKYPNIAWLDFPDFAAEPTNYTAHDIGGNKGLKYDLIELIDLDQDGDLDVLTCEEADNLGVLWYENPTVTK